ncbi:MAG TPA: LpxD N-terminal domain-containing protein, partial [Candidatus Acidoferrales bacterium]|nr:LpxD N-terminal domain-containing protein [Candidatus Acidoferrales bacterium]
MSGAALTLADWAVRAGGTVRGDSSLLIERISAIDEADRASLTFATDERYLRAALASRAAAVLTEPALAEKLEAVAKPLLLVPSTRAALATLLASFARPQPLG